MTHAFQTRPSLFVSDINHPLVQTRYQKPEPDLASVLQLPEVQEELKALRAQALNEGYRAGQVQAELEAQKMIEKKCASLELLTSNFNEALDHFRVELEPILRDTSLRLAEHLVRQKLQIEPQLLQGLVDEALNCLGDKLKDTKIRINPQDAPYIKIKAEVVHDPKISPGGFIIDSTTSSLDASLETRLSSLAAKFTGPV